MKEIIFNFNSLNKCRKFQLLNNGYLNFDFTAQQQ